LHFNASGGRGMTGQGERIASVCKTDHLYRRGQHIIYKGEHARVLEVAPVFTIRISGASHVICGNIWKDVKPVAGKSA